MSDIPSGWYDDPENPAMYRYWDGQAWTDHRSPKAGPPRPTSRSAPQLIGDILSFVGAHWRDLTVVAVPMLAFSMLGVVLAYGGFESALSPGVDEIIDRVSEPGFSTDNPDDDAFIDSIEFDLTAGAVSLWIAALVAFVLTSLVGPIAIARYTVGAEQGRPPSVGEAWSGAVPRAAKLLGVILLTIAALTAAIVGLVVLAIVTPFTLLITIPALIAGVVWAVPVITMISAAVAVGPSRQPVISTGTAVIRGRWPGIALRLLLVWVTVVAVGIPFSFISTPVAAASLWGAIVLNTALQALQTVFSQVGNVSVYRWADGPIDPALTPVGE